MSTIQHMRRLTIEEPKFRWELFLVWVGCIVFSALCWGAALYFLFSGSR